MWTATFLLSFIWNNWVSEWEWDWDWDWDWDNGIISESLTWLGWKVSASHLYNVISLPPQVQRNKLEEKLPSAKRWTPFVLCNLNSWGPLGSSSVRKSYNTIPFFATPHEISQRQRSEH
jgi:hypothetical protein